MISQFLSRFDFSDPHFGQEMFFFVAIIWCVVLVSAVWSICSKMQKWPARAFWIAIVVCLPLVGLLLYLPFSIDSDSFQSFVRFGRRS
jgi:chromate transport protein ChrA